MDHADAPRATSGATTDDRAPSSAEPLLEVEGLQVHFPFRRGPWWRRVSGAIRAVEDVSFSVEEGRTFGLVGESGCGKSTTARAALNLVRTTAGEVYLEGQRITGLDESAMRPYRQTMQMIFQDPFASLNPRMTVGRIIAEPMTIFNLHDRQTRRLEAMRLMELVGLNPRFLNRYPHEFSGGQRQRIGVARALAVEPKLIFCDEPISALDVSIQAQVINLLMELQERLRLAYVFIAHDLSVVRHISDTVGVMYLGRLVEVAPADELYRNPRHPYTQALLAAVPLPNPVVERAREHVALKGEVPSPDQVYHGCAFADRCPLVEARCRESRPPLEGDEHRVACFVANNGGT